jgi:hypothetical protein
MKKNELILFLLCTLFLGCQSRSSKLSEMQAKWDKSYEDSLFKGGTSLKIYDRRAIDFDEVNGSWFYDNLIKSELLSLKEFTEESINRWKELAQPFGSGIADEGAFAEVKKERLKLKEIDRLLKKADAEKIRYTGGKFYIYREYLKATITPENGKPHNVMDTIKAVFNDNLDPVLLKSELPKNIQDFEKVISSLEEVAKEP